MFSVLSILLLVIFSRPVKLSENFPPCRTHADGMCIDYSEWECPEGYIYAYSGCGFREKCCYPPQAEATKTTVSTKDVTESPKDDGPQCGVSTINPDVKIVGGTRTSITAHPWQVSIMIDRYHTCGGSIISDRWILTAAHCLYRVRTTRLTILAGVSIIKRYSSSHVYKIERKVEHDDYDVDTYANDIALIKLSKPLDLTDRNMRAVCLPDAGVTFDNQVCVASGWGSSEEVENAGDEDMMTYLRHVAVPIVSDDMCYYYNGWVPDKFVCGGHTSGGKDTCQGDSGGPLVCKQRDGSWIQAGVVSHGYGCARENTMGYYTEIASYKSWIDSMIEKYDD